MQPAHAFGVEIDTCPGCRGMFLDPGEAEAQGLETATLFGVARDAAQDAGLTRRLCPVHGAEMRRYRIGTDNGVIEIERSDCCGGLFLDAGEHAPFAHAARRAASLAAGLADDQVRTGSGAVFSAPPPPPGPDGATASAKQSGFANFCRGMAAMDASEQNGGGDDPPRPIRATQSSGRHCPRCGNAYQADRSSGIEIDVCAQCGSVFLDAGEDAAKGADTSALFGVASEAATEIGPSQLACPACNQTMRAVHVTTLAGTIEVDRAGCCGGLYLDGGEWDPFTRAAKVAQRDAADRQFAKTGQAAGEAAIMQTMGDRGATSQYSAVGVRKHVDSAMRHIMEQRARRHRHHHHHDHHDDM